MKLVIDPSLIWSLPYDEDKFKYLDELINFVDKLLVENIYQVIC